MRKVYISREETFANDVHFYSIFLILMQFLPNYVKLFPRKFIPAKVYSLKGIAYTSEESKFSENQIPKKIISVGVE